MQSLHTVQEDIRGGMDFTRRMGRGRRISLSFNTQCNNTSRSSPASFEGLDKV